MHCTVYKVVLHNIFSLYLLLVIMQCFQSREGSGNQLNRLKQGVLGQTIEGSPERFPDSAYDLVASMQVGSTNVSDSAHSHRM